MRRSLALFSLIAVFLALPALAAAARPTIALSIDAGGTFVQFYDTPVGTSFDVVVWVDTDGETLQAVEFVMTELSLAVPGVMTIGTSRVTPVFTEIADNSQGEYLFEIGALDDPDCVGPSSQLELVRIEYLDNTGAIGSDQLLALQGLGPGASVAGSFGGDPGFADCGLIKHALEVGGVDGGYTNTGLTVPDGSVVLNPTLGFVAAGRSSMGLQKARF